ncbi:MAG: hypothetical protein ACRYFY_18350, partial [Janthinobacterium lividum]
AAPQQPALGTSRHNKVGNIQTPDLRRMQAPLTTVRWSRAAPRRDGRKGKAVRLGFRLAKGLNNQHAAQLVAHRSDRSYRSVEEIWRRADIPAVALERLAEADAFQDMGLDRRQALWQVKGLADNALPLFAAADAGRRPQPELVEPPVPLARMKDGREVVEDYRSIGLSLRAHPVSFIRSTLQAQGMVTCAGLKQIRDGRRVIVPGIVLVRQRPGTAKGIMFLTIEDETGVANLILWADRFEAQRRLVLSAGMIACHGRVQREGEVIHVITDRLEDLSELLRSVSDKNGTSPVEDEPGETASYRINRNPRDHSVVGPGGPPVRDIFMPHTRLGYGIRIPTRDFR